VKALNKFGRLGWPLGKHLDSLHKVTSTAPSFRGLFSRFRSVISFFQRTFSYRFFLVKIVRSRRMDHGTTLRTREEFVRVKFLDGRMVVHSRAHRDIGFREFRNVKVSPNRRGGFITRGSRILSNDNLLGSIPKYYFANTSVGGIEAQYGPLVVANWSSLKKRSAGEAIFIGSMAPHNWYHWLIDFLPSIYFLRELPEQYSDYPVLVPREGLQKENWRRALSLSLSGRQMLEVGGSELWKLRKLLVVEPVTRVHPRPLRTENFRLSIAPSLVRSFSEEIKLSANPISSIQGRRRIFLARGTGDSRNYNQDEIFAVCSKFGFEFVELPSLSFDESVRLFENAQAIVSPHSAGLANIIFCREGTPVTYWTWAGETVDNWYENIAFISGVELRKIEIPTGPGTADPRGEDYFLSPRRLREELEKVDNLLQSRASPV